MNINELSAALGIDLHTVMVIVLLTIPFVLLSIWAIVHSSAREFDTEGQKILWVMIAAIPFIGFIIYLAVGIRRSRKPGVPQNRQDSQD